MHAPQPLVLAGAFLLGFYAVAGSLVVGVVRALTRDRCGQAH